MIFALPPSGDDLSYYYRHVVRQLVRCDPHEGVALLPVDADSFLPLEPAERAAVNIGVYVPCTGLISEQCMRRDRVWDVLIVPSHHVEYQLRLRGVSNVITVLPGCDNDELACPVRRARDGRFIVGSSGRFSPMNGHDLVLRVMRQFMASHADCWFACNWELTAEGFEEMRSTARISLEQQELWDVSGILGRNGIDPGRTVIMTAGQPDRDIRAGSDLYIAPFRASSGIDVITDSLLLAARPVIAPRSMAQAKGLAADSGLLLQRSVPVIASDAVTLWFEASEDEMLEKLELAYRRWLEGGEHDGSGVPRQRRSWRQAAEEIESLAGHVGLKLPGGEPLPVTAATWNRRGSVCTELEEFEAAERHYAQALAVSPLNAETFNCMGNLKDRQQQYQQALLYFDKALSLNQAFAAAAFNKANTLKRMESLEEAIDTYRKCVGIDPQFVLGWLNLAIAYAFNEQLNMADECFLKTLELDPHNTDALFLRGNQLLNQQRYEEAISCYQHAIQADPSHYLALNSLGVAYLSLTESKSAYDALRSALAIRPDMTTAMTNIGTACRDMDRLDEAVLWFRRALELEPDDADTHWNLALALLHLGDYGQGWCEYEWRFSKSEKIVIPPSDLPLWQGDELRGRSILLQAEQGYGDTIQFVRYAARLAELGATVCVECQDDSIKSVAACVPGVAVAVNRQEPKPVSDVRAPLMSLPYLMKTGLDSIPFPGGYIRVPEQLKSYWGDRLAGMNPANGLRVGFVWDGRKTFRNDKRSVPLDVFKSLFEVDGICFVNLQKGGPELQLKQFAAAYRIVDIAEELKTFLDTAALIANLDLVISVDTSVAHLAAAVGIPTWVMLKIGPDWRWLHGRDDSPWYSAVRLFRQTEDGNWDDVVARIYNRLDELKLTIKD